MTPATPEGSRSQGPDCRRVVVLIMLAVTVMAVPVKSQVPGCRDAATTPLPDLVGTYRGLAGGLYPGGRTTPPPEHLAIGLDRARHRIAPLDVEGRPSADGKVIFMALGMSNTASEFARFVDEAARQPAINRHLVILNGALSGADATAWARPGGAAWRAALSRVAGRRDLSAQQVQAIWIKQAHLKTVPFPAEIEAFKADLASIVRIATTVFPNLRIAYVSSRTRAGAPTRRGPGEPQAYETAFAVRRLVGEQIEGSGIPVDAVWVSWGPYLWSRGAPPRSDGLSWTCADLQPDRLHPTESGNQKVADQLLAFFMASPTTVPWFLDSAKSGRGLEIERVVPSKTSGTAPLAVKLSAITSGATRYFWSFADGTSSTDRDPVKTFYVEGEYDVRLTVVDELGRWAHHRVRIQVAPAAD